VSAPLVKGTWHTIMVRWLMYAWHCWAMSVPHVPCVLTSADFGGAAKMSDADFLL